MATPLNTQLKKRLCKDFKLPINIFSEPYFEYFVDLYDSHYQVNQKIKWMQQVLENCSDQEEFFAMSQNIAQNMKKTIQSSKAYENFNNIDLSKELLLKEQIKQQNIYIVPNIGKSLISVDLEKANFNCFNLFGLKKELGVDSYNDLMKKFTQDEYFLNSKMIRQVIFGDLNPARQQRIQRYIINNLCAQLLKNGCTLSSASSDEIIITNDISVKQVREILSNVDEKFKFFRVDQFSFEKIDKDSDYFIKTTIKENGKIEKEFKSVPLHFHAQIFKKYYNIPINENDLLFYHEGFLAQFKEPLFKPQVKNKLTI